MNKFGLISEIKVNESETWMNRIFLTFDIDWASDFVLKDTLEILIEHGARATFFATHNTQINTIISSSEDFELGIHPNFNLLLNGDFSKGNNIHQVISNTLTFSPKSVSVRSHSITQNGPILEAFAKNGITHDSNDYIPEFSGIKLVPWVTANGMTKVPYCWADEHAYCNRHSDSFHEIVERVGLAVFDFHPIHIFLNTDSVFRYSNSRHLHQKPDDLINHRFKGYGSRNRLFDLLNL
jgi:hypothetical protein